MPHRLKYLPFAAAIAMAGGCAATCRGADAGGANPA